MDKKEVVIEGGKKVVPCPFAEIQPGQGFRAGKYTHITENGRPWVYFRIGETNSAIFHPDGKVYDFSPDETVMPVDIAI